MAENDFVERRSGQDRRKGDRRKISILNGNDRRKEDRRGEDNNRRKKEE